ncbi:MAG: HisA/HisF-related TIM barrel protein [Candidatus Nanopelagicales bacterium]
MQNHSFALIPTIHVSNGHAPIPSDSVLTNTPQLVTPLAAARFWYEQGARRIQIVDVDAMNGGQANTSAITQLVHGVRHQQRTDLVVTNPGPDTLAAAIRIDPTQIVLDTAAVADLGFLSAAVAQHGGEIGLRLVVGDAGAIRAPGTAADGLDVWQLLPQLDALPIANYLVSDAGHQGHWWQAHHDILTDFCNATSGSVTAGSGVVSLENLHNLADLVPAGLDGAVIGRALEDGTFTYAEAQTAVEARYDPYEWGPARP